MNRGTRELVLVGHEGGLETPVGKIRLRQVALKTNKKKKSVFEHAKIPLKFSTQIVVLFQLTT